MSFATRNLLLGTVFFIVAAAGVWLLWPDEDAIRTEDAARTGEVSAGAFAAKTARGTAENPQARLEYELRRLRNPETGEIPSNIRKREVAFAKKLPTRRPKTSSWQRRGPYTIGGRSRALRVDMRSTSAGSATIVAGGVSGGMWRSTDGGDSWARTFAPDQRPSVTWVTQDPRPGNRDTWYATTGELRGNSASGGRGAFYLGNGVYKSTDNGQSWSLLSSTAGTDPTALENPFEVAHRVAVDSTTGDVYVAALGSIQRSTDGGNSWTTVLDTEPNASSAVAWTDVSITSSGRIYAVLSDEGNGATTQTGVFTSTTGDAGDWTDITPGRSGRPGSWPSTPTRTISAIDPSNEDLVWFLTKAQNGSGPNGHELQLYDASSGGQWDDFTDVLPTRSGLGTFNSQGAYDLIMEVHPDNSDLLFVGGRNLWRLDLSNSDAAWIGGYSPSGGGLYPNQHPDQHAIDFLPTDGDVMFTGSDGGLHRTDDNRSGGDGDVTYTSLNNGYYTTQFYAVCQTQDLSSSDAIDVIAGGMQDNSTYSTTATANPTDPWRQETGADGGYCEIADGGTLRYVSTQGGNVTRNEYNASGTRTGSSNVTPSGASGQLFINPFILDPSDQTVMYYPAGSSLWRNPTVDTDGTNWTELTGAEVPSSHTITALDASAANSEHVLYYGTNDGSDSPGPGRVYRLNNADTAPPSTSPTEVTGSNFPDGGYVSSIAVDPTNSDNVLVAFSNYGVTSLFYTTDGGSSWTDVEANLGGSDGPSIRSVDILPRPQGNETLYYAGTSVGVYSAVGLDGSSTNWQQESPNSIGLAVVDQVRARPSDRRVIAGTHASGVYSTAAPVPVEFAQFRASVTGSSVRLNWTTASETNNAGFDVQHRYRDSTFESLGFVEGAGTTSEPQTYSYKLSESLPPGRHTFRLKQIDVGGASEVSSERTVTIRPEGAYELTPPAPNPFRETSRFRLTVQEGQSVTVSLYNALGQRVRTLLQKEIPANRPVDLRLQGDGLASGMYIIRVEGEVFETTQKVTLVR